ncbi:MAG TPA: ATP-binding protein [Humisphaera sp.]|jgi:transitional endoplasmic reticulum ATPase|nr:ATP-binding protein [Humisphaera sp.]
MSISWDTFERYRQKGLDARRAGQWDSARIYLLEAARASVELSKEAQTEDLKQGRRQMAEKLLELAKDCESAAKEGRRQPTLRRQSGGASSAQASESEGESSAKQWIVKEKPSLRFADVAGLEDVKEDIRLKMIYPFEHPELAEKFGIRPGGGVLMYGPPGTGKTMLAKATAGEIDATFFCISPADVLSKWVGEAEQNIKKLFDAAAAEPRSIIFIDEIEALVPARRDDGSSVMQRVVPQILQGVEGFDKKAGRSILLMGATNVPWQLDPAMMRPGRFDEKVYIPLPDIAARRKMLDLNLAKRPVAPDLDLDALAHQLDGFSGADIKYICDRAATIPFLQSVSSGQEQAISLAILQDVIGETMKSVTPEMLRRFAEWAKAAASA